MLGMGTGKYASLGIWISWICSRWICSIFLASSFSTSSPTSSGFSSTAEALRFFPALGMTTSQKEWARKMVLAQLESAGVRWKIAAKK